MKDILGLIIWFLPMSAHAVMNGRGQDIFPQTAIFNSSATITYINAANSGRRIVSLMPAPMPMAGRQGPREAAPR